jgi:hypothetical protein
MTFDVHPRTIIFSLLLLSFIVFNMGKFQDNFGIHSIKTRYKYDFHMLNAIFIKYQVYYAEIRLFVIPQIIIESLNEGAKLLNPH